MYVACLAPLLDDMHVGVDSPVFSFCIVVAGLLATLMVPFSCTSATASVAAPRPDPGRQRHVASIRRRGLRDFVSSLVFLVMAKIASRWSTLRWSVYLGRLYSC